MADVAKKSQSKPPQWVQFSGRIRQKLAEKVELAPAEDDKIKLTLWLSDVLHLFQDQTREEFILVRVGSKLVSFDAGNSPEFKSRPVGEATESCPKGSKCIGNLEYCCGSDEVVGGCHGYWRCE